MTEQSVDYQNNPEAERLSEYIEQGNLSDGIKELLDFMQRSDVVEQRRKFTDHQLRYYFSYLVLMGAIKDVAQQSSSEEASIFDFAEDILGNEVIGFVLDDDTSEPVPAETLLRVETEDRSGGKTAIKIVVRPDFKNRYQNESERDLIQKKVGEVYKEALGLTAKLMIETKFAVY